MAMLFFSHAIPSIPCNAFPWFAVTCFVLPCLPFFALTCLDMPLSCLDTTLLALKWLCLPSFFLDFLCLSWHEIACLDNWHASAFLDMPLLIFLVARHCLPSFSFACLDMPLLGLTCLCLPCHAFACLDMLLLVFASPCLPSFSLVCFRLPLLAFACLDNWHALACHCSPLLAFAFLSLTFWLPRPPRFPGTNFFPHLLLPCSALLLLHSVITSYLNSLPACTRGNYRSHLSAFALASHARVQNHLVQIYNVAKMSNNGFRRS